MNQNIVNEQTLEDFCYCYDSIFSNLQPDFHDFLNLPLNKRLDLSLALEYECKLSEKISQINPKYKYDENIVLDRVILIKSLYPKNILDNFCPEVVLSATIAQQFYEMGLRKTDIVTKRTNSDLCKCYKQMIKSYFKSICVGYENEVDFSFISWRAENKLVYQVLSSQYTDMTIVNSSNYSKSFPIDLSSIIFRPEQINDLRLNLFDFITE
ncbi:hypothetical protein KY334_00290 [Candidatus Woesearchaeota archaeon]|nr:hypothetical protein [Candidatus Woesearchaeota archaeon]